MRSSFVLLALSSTLLVSAVPIARRSVPHEHAWEKVNTATNLALKLNNPAGFVDAVFALLGDATAAAGDSKSNPVGGVCLQAAIADQAFSNAKAAGDIEGMTSALTFRALERNTGSVGQASKPCVDFKPVNPEVAAISQHQDAASSGAAAANKASTLALAKSIASIGGDPQRALDASTFAPGQIGDPTAAGGTCDDANDKTGCIFTQNLAVPDATAQEIAAAVAGIASNGVQTTAQGSQGQTAVQQSAADSPPTCGALPAAR